MKKRDRDFTSLPFGASKGGENRSSIGASGGSPFSLSRLFPSRRRRHHSKSRMSLDSDSTKSESSLASHNVTSTSLPAFYNNMATPVSRPHLAPGIAMMTLTSGLSTTTSSLPATVLTVQSSRGAVGGESTEVMADGMTRECPVCMMEQTLDCFPPIQTCDHRSCLECLRHYLRVEISESRINITCPECSQRFHPNDMRMILDDEKLMGKYEDFMLRRVLAMDPDTRWCPAPDCGYAVIAAGCAGCPKLQCEREGCGTFFCYHCKQQWHPNQTCDAARAERSPKNRSASISYSHESSSQNEIKPCPRCGAFIVKMNDGSCNHMTCAVCAAEFCWLCMKEISDLHYLSPSGCTFWGRKPWSRKKKILWQLGTLVGAPLGISLVAGIAVPAMIIGIPVWVGRKIHAHYRMSPKHRRNLAVTGGVLVSILASPIVAGLAVGIGVPILLAYVYGVVPISLCRSGGCGVTTTNTGGVRFEFDEENEANGHENFTGDNQSETMPAVANPSIAPSIGDASLGMTGSLSASGSHMDRVGIQRDADSDRDSASNRALAGASLNGSLCGSTYANKLEVQADVIPGGVTHKRASFSSESANISLSEKSATVSFDEASLRVVYTDHAREGSEACGYHSEGQDNDSASVFTTAPSSQQSPRTMLRSSAAPSCTAAAEDVARHGTKCKKLTRFMDDVHTVTPSSNVVVAADSYLNAVLAADSYHKGHSSKGCESVAGEMSRTGNSDWGTKARSSSEMGARCKISAVAWAEKVESTPCRLKQRLDHVTGKTIGNGQLQSIGASGTTYRETDFPWKEVDVARCLPTVPRVLDTNDTVGSGSRGSGVSRGSGGVCREKSSANCVLPEVDADKSILSHSASLPEVDTDKPVVWHSSSPSGVGDAFLSRRLSLSCTSLDRKGMDSANQLPAAVEGSDSSIVPLPGQSCRSMRRHSYELAHSQGRITPSLLEDSH